MPIAVGLASRMRDCLRKVAFGALVGAMLLTSLLTTSAIAQGPGGEQQVMKLKSQFTPAKDGQPARLFVTAIIADHWHIYSITQPSGGPIRTKIEIKSPKENSPVKLLDDFRAYPEPKKGKQPEAFGNIVIETHADRVTWFAPIEIAKDVDVQNLKIEGTLFFQACKEDSCLPPRTVSFIAKVGDGVKIPPKFLEAPKQTEKPKATESEKPNAQPAAEKKTSSEGTAAPAAAPIVAKAPADEGSAEWRPFSKAFFLQCVGDRFDPVAIHQYVISQDQSATLGSMLCLGFLGGIILNIMPCVLPVIGLKVLSFVEQAGKSRSHAFLLNVWYSVGLISVFMILAALAAFAQLGWGGLFQYAAFNVVMAAVVFMMGLSFLGVWEIPIPGFVSGGKGAELATKEGFSGAFLKGVITTLLATPCTGPMMASALAWAVRQPPQNTFLVFFSIGLGMASPYLLIGAFPGLVKFLPKPGAWMETFKQIMGFVLMATVVYIFTFLDLAYVVPSFALLMVIWAACWRINRVPIYEEWGKQAVAWLQSTAVTVIAVFLLFVGINNGGEGFSMGSLKDYMAERLENRVQTGIAKTLQERRAQGFDFVAVASTGETKKAEGKAPASVGGKTVIVDFTADWCATCKTLENTVLKSEAFLKAVRDNRIVLMKADWTVPEPDIDAMLKMLGANQVPVLAIFPADAANRPIVKLGGYLVQDLLDDIEKAGPSKPAGS